MKYIISIVQISLLLLTMVACNKEEADSTGIGDSGYRVKKITGHNELWQDYTMECAYENGRLDSAVIYHHNKSVKSLLYMTYKTDLTEAEILDVVPMVDQDSMAKLDPDSIPYAMETAMLIRFTVDEANRIKSQHIEYWRPMEQEPDEDYEYRYEMKEQINFLYEYAEDGRLLIWRSPNYQDDVYKAKCEYAWNGKQVTQAVLFYYEGGAWNPIQTEKFAYEGSRLSSWETQGGVKGQYTWVGERLEHVVFTGMGSREISYRYNSEGLVNKITYSNGDTEEITYESGTGNYAWFTLPLEQVYRLPSGLGCLGKASYLPFYEK